MSSRFEQKPFARRVRPCLTALLCVGLNAVSARAQTEDIRIEYRALPGCPSAEEFNSEVFKRTSSARLVGSGAEVRTFVVEIEQRRGSLTGSLRVREGRTETVAREVQGDGCSEVASALALATALAIDPNASFDAPRSQPDGAPPTNTGAASASGESNTKPSVNPLPVLPREPDRLDPGAQRSSAGERRGFYLSLGPSLLTGVTPRVSVGGSLSAEHDAHASGWLSSLGVELTVLRGLESESAGAHAAFQFVHARPTLCSFRLGPADGFSVSPCVAAELGVLSGWGSDIPREESHTKLWASADALLKLRLARPSSWLVELQAGAVFPLTRYDFVFLDPKTPVHSVPPVAFAAGLRIGVPLGG